ncbi:hypothetical protein [Duncaniella muris]
MKYIEMQQGDDAPRCSQVSAGFLLAAECPECKGDRLNRRRFTSS